MGRAAAPAPPRAALQSWMCLLSMAPAQLSSAQGRAQLSLPQHRHRRCMGERQISSVCKSCEKYLMESWLEGEGQGQRAGTGTSAPGQGQKSPGLIRQLPKAAPREPCLVWRHHPVCPTDPLGWNGPCSLTPAGSPSGPSQDAGLQIFQKLSLLDPCPGPDLCFLGSSGTSLFRAITEDLFKLQKSLWTRNPKCIRHQDVGSCHSDLLDECFPSALQPGSLKAFGSDHTGAEQIPSFHPGVSVCSFTSQFSLWN